MEKQDTTVSMETLRQERDANRKVPPDLYDVPYTLEALLERMRPLYPEHVRHAEAVREDMFDKLYAGIGELCRSILHEYGYDDMKDRAHTVYVAMLLDCLGMYYTYTLVEHLPPRVAAGLAADMAVLTSGHATKKVHGDGGLEALLNGMVSSMTTGNREEAVRARRGNVNGSGSG